MKHVSFVLLAAFLSLMAMSCSMPEVIVSPVALSEVKDGDFKGFYDGGIVKVEVLVRIKSHRIESVDILRHDCGKGRKAETITASIIEKQSPVVDAVTGATYSSKCIAKAVENALREACK